MALTRQHQEFNYYCLDRLQSFENDLKLTYNDGNVIKRVLYKIGLKAKIKHEECFILYTNSDLDLDQFVYIDVDAYYQNQRHFFNDIISIAEMHELIKNIKTINIFEFASLLEFTNIYDDFKGLVEDNWTNLDMDSLIEI